MISISSIVNTRPNSDEIKIQSELGLYKFVIIAK